MVGFLVYLGWVWWYQTFSLVMDHGLETKLLWLWSQLPKGPHSLRDWTCYLVSHPTDQTIHRMSPAQLRQTLLCLVCSPIRANLGTPTLRIRVPPLPSAKVQERSIYIMTNTYVLKKTHVANIFLLSICNSTWLYHTPWKLLALLNTLFRWEQVRKHRLLREHWVFGHKFLAVYITRLI